MMRRQGSGNKPGCPGPYPKFLDGLHGREFDVWVVGQPKIIIRGKEEDFPPFYRNNRNRRGIDER
jgi:hypothetical protein